MPETTLAANPSAVPDRRPLRAARRMLRVLSVFGNDKVAAAHMVYFLVSAALFMPLIGGVLYFMRDVTDSQFDDDVGLEPRARVILDRLTGSTGVLDGGSTYWQDREDGAQGLKEAGIRHDTDRLRLSPEKLENLQRGGLEWDTETPFVDYPELKDALGVDERYDFFLRMAPNLHSRDLDPFGTRPLGGAHVAYFGKLTSGSQFDGDYDEFDAVAKGEIDALENLGLGYEAGEAGFTTTPYYPRECDGLLGLNPLQHGTVVADTAYVIEGRDSGLTCLDSDEHSYRYWFLQNYFFNGDSDPRFDALVFGSGVDVAAWFDEAENHDNQSVDENLFVEFVEQGGTIIFLDNNGGNGWEGDVTRCESVDDHCVLSRMGEQVPMRIPDDTNQMLRSPNKLPQIPFRDDDQPWKLWNEDPATELNESQGFIPMFVADPTWDPDPVVPEDPHFLRVHLGATTSDRYAGNGGTVILSNWDLDGLDEDGRTKVFSNMLNYGILRIAYLDVGPELPNDRVVRAVAKNGVVELANGEILEVRMQLFLWRS